MILFHQPTVRDKVVGLRPEFGGEMNCMGDWPCESACDVVRDDQVIFHLGFALYPLWDTALHHAAEKSQARHYERCWQQATSEVFPE